MVQADFKAMERSGWSERAAIYNDYTGTLCRQAIAPLLHEGEVAGSHAVLDGGCGTGAAAAEAARLGASVTAVDFSDDMVEVARARCPGAAVCAGDAEALVFEDASFDRVVCNFGILHVADPDRAIAEAARVLKSGGRYAFTAWRGPEVSPFFRIVMDAVSESGTLDVDLPPAPPMFRFSDEAECARTLRAARFTDIRCADVPVKLEFVLEDLPDFLRNTFVRTTMLLDRQTPEARAAIERTLVDKLAAFSDGRQVSVPFPALVASGVRRTPEASQRR